MNDTDRTDVIPGLRTDDTLTSRTRRDVPTWAWATVGGVLLAGVGLIAWSSLGGPSDHKAPAAVVSSPSESTPAAEAPVSLPPTTTALLPQPTATHTAPKPSPTHRATRSSSPRSTPSPTPTRIHDSSPAPSPTRTREEPSPSPTDTDAPPTFTPPTITPGATDGQ